MKNPFKKEQIIRKQTFSYEKSGVSLSFTLNLGNKGEMINFKELLEKALVDVSEELNKEKDFDGYGASGAGRLIERDSN